jgi:hypothetical protein
MVGQGVGARPMSCVASTMPAALAAGAFVTLHCFNVDIH